MIEIPEGWKGDFTVSEIKIPSGTDLGGATLEAWLYMQHVPTNNYQIGSYPCKTEKP